MILIQQNILNLSISNWHKVEIQSNQFKNILPCYNIKLLNIRWMIQTLMYAKFKNSTSANATTVKPFV